MKKGKEIFILILTVIFVIVAVCAAALWIFAPKQIENIKNEYAAIKKIDDYTLEYNGREYKYFDESKYYEFIKDEKILEKKDSFFPETYYTLKNDENNDFIYVGIFRDSRLYTTLPIHNYKDVIKGEPTSIIISKLGYETETRQISDNPLAIEQAVALRELEDSTGNLQTYNKQDHDGWYYISVFYDNMPIASIVTEITVVDHHGEYLLLCSATDNTYSGIGIENGAITDLVESIKSKQNNQ